MSLKDRLGLEKEPLYLVDGTAFIYRSFYAYRDMRRSDGSPSNALYMIVRMLLKILREEKPEFFAFFIDGKGPNFRHEAYEPYKANRSATPEELLAQLDPVKEAVSRLGLLVQVSEGCEADDCIASMAARYKGERPVVIIGTDKDLKQCLDDGVYMWDPMKSDKLTTVDDFRQETGLEPSRWADFQAVIGDSSDNIPGIPGVGPKTAQKIFSRFPSLEDIRDNIEDLTPSERKKVEPAIDDVFVYRKLTTLLTDACQDVTLERMTCRPIDPEAVTSFVQEWEFRTLLRELAPTFAAVGAQAQSAPEAKKGGGQAQPSLFDAVETEGPEKAAGKGAKSEKKSVAAAQGSLFGDDPFAGQSAREVKTAESVDALPDMADAEVGAVRTEQGFRLGIGEDEWLYTGKAAPLAEALKGAAAVYTPSVKDRLGYAHWRDIDLSVWFDLGLAAYLLNPEERDYGFAHLVRRWGPETEAHPDNEGLMALAMGREMARRMEAAELSRLFRQLEMPLISVLADMERAGIAIDQQAFTDFLTQVKTEIEKVTARIYEVSGAPFNLRSSQQLGELLFGRLGLKPGGKTSTGAASTSQSVLEKLSGQHPVIADILEFRKLEKLRSTYLEPLPKLMDEDGRIHTTFNQLATATGRLSSSGPNLQNIPIRGEEGRRMRHCFRAGGDNLLVAADYSQIELRVLAHMSGDPTLVEAFSQGEDIHSRTAALLFDTTTDEITADQRRNAKTINFGLVYGMGPQKLAQELKITMKEAKAFIERYFSRLQKLKEFYDAVEEDAREKGHVKTITGRRRLLPDIHSRNNQLRSQARRQAINTVIQGSAADIIKIAMLKVHGDEELRRLGATLILQVHDELLLEVRADGDAPLAERAEKAGERLRDLMVDVLTGDMELSVPLLVDVGVGRDWGVAH